MPVPVFFPPRVHDDSGDSDAGIENVKATFRAGEPAMINVRPKRHVAGCSLVVFRRSVHAGSEVEDAANNDEHQDNEQESFLHRGEAASRLMQFGE